MTTRNTAPNRPATQRALGSIRADEAMPSEEFRRRFGISQKAWRSMLSHGLKAVACGKIKIVLGEDAIRFFRALSEAEGQQG